jgi:hypothetical protein
MTESIWRTSDRRLRQFAVLWTLFFIGLVIRFVWPSPQIVLGAGLGLVSLFGLIGCYRPQIIRPIYVTWMIAVFPMGWTISHLLLAVLFFGLFTPIGFLLRMCGRDALGLKLQFKTASYWTKKEGCIDKCQYLQQF